MQDNGFYTVRFRFAKVRSAKYISHLDLSRLLARAIRRTDLPVWYTQGFNPHVYMGFSLPLPLGVESVCESVDLRFVEEIDENQALQTLNAVLPPDVQLLGAYRTFSEPEAICYSTYLFQLDVADGAFAAQKLQQALEADRIPAEKKGKAGRRRVVRTVDLKPMIHSCKIEHTEASVRMEAVLNAGPSKNLNPVLLLDTLLKLAELHFEWRSVKRLNLLKADLTEYI